MKANELMIDDWVLYKGKMPCKITAICKDTAVVDNDTEQDWRIDYDKLTPISLTAEILEKNFNCTEIQDDPYGACFFCCNDYIEVYIEEYTDGLWQMVVDEIEMSGLPTWRMFVSNVHELQHALRLAGIDKEIEL